MSARGPIHAMLPDCDSPAEADAREAELDRRLDAYRAEVLVEVAETIEETVRLFEDSEEAAVAAGALEGLADRFRRMARGKQAPASTESAPGFFQPKHTYARAHHASTIRFLVKYIDDSPDGTYRVAFGWRIEDGDVCWSPFDSDDLTGWVDVTEAGAR